ncbi:brain protein I3 [Callorhinchus milii]|uniref:Membrane protein BRI3 n=1 Tax=Callorhinchus milii TaxID=7868 RepID=V9KJY0_CALMI|nr:brain protein I3 [Callorhinchus milii]|eukprot:gi/632952258/ref/XP_007891752.1/ PREDICTED: brain protein I3 [Callorhinchus milii]
MDNKPLLSERPPAYAALPAGYEYGQTYGTITPPGYQPPPPPYYTQPGYNPPPLPPLGLQQPTCPVPAFPNTYIITQQPTPASVVVVGGCPACRVGVLEDDFTCLGVLCAILFFPIGILFCLALRQRRCPNCGATFG